jgi:hypothetical protein
MTRIRMGNGGRAPQFLTSALDGGEWSASRPCRFTPAETVPTTHWIGGWVDPRGGMDTVDKNLLPLHRIESRFLGRPARSLVAILTELSLLLPLVYSGSQNLPT